MYHASDNYDAVRAPAVWARGWDGSGVTIAMLDTGCSAWHPDLLGRIVSFCDFTLNEEEETGNPRDDNGHGTHIAGILVGNGRMSRGKIRGMAPGARLAVGKVLDRSGGGSIRSLLRGLDWISRSRERLGIRIVNISVGGPEKEGQEGEHSLLVRRVNRLWDEGLVIVTAAGNNGPRPGSVTTPGISRKVITVGCSDEESAGRTADAHRFSGRGPTRNCVIKPEVLAPGIHIPSCALPRGRYPQWYERRSGTSMAVPFVSGAIALLLQKYPELTNVEIKCRLRASCRRTAEPGWGVLQTDRLLS